MNLKQAINAYWDDLPSLGRWAVDNMTDSNFTIEDEDGNVETVYIGKCRFNFEDVGYVVKMELGDSYYEEDEEDDEDEDFEEEETEGGDGAANFV